jgi:hypothetical protein
MSMNTISTYLGLTLKPDKIRSVNMYLYAFVILPEQIHVLVKIWTCRRKVPTSILGQFTGWLS